MFILGGVCSTADTLMDSSGALLSPPKLSVGGAWLMFDKPSEDTLGAGDTGGSAAAWAGLDTARVGTAGLEAVRGRGGVAPVESLAKEDSASQSLTPRAARLLVASRVVLRSEGGSRLGLPGTRPDKLNEGILALLLAAELAVEAEELN